ncbi:sigma-70 family RNA polymerase sigma factor [Luteolibacter soli]|uniref:Sigma-70 family RNA polymerase sigma factor n=1 Tax=Luteolibacter soli TaxID=3135280 RepID=A0ABU9B4R5_9BACT
MAEAFDLEKHLDDILGGQTDAFLGIVREYGPSLRTFLGTQLFHLNDLDDLAQEVFIVAYERLPTFVRSENFGAWLRGIARNKLRHHYERTSRRTGALELFQREAVNLLEADLDTAASRTKEVHLEALLGCIGKLPDRMRRVIRGWLDQEKALALAREMALSVPNIYQIQHRASALLRDCVERNLSHGS